MTLGNATIPNLPYPIRWNPPEGLKILGVIFFRDPLKTANATWNEIIQKIQNRAAFLSSRRLSFQGKRTIINSLLLSRGWHVATVIPALKKHVEQIEDVIFKYMFSNKLPHKPKEEVFTLLLQHGGVSLKNFQLQQNSLRLNRYRLILDPTKNAPWIRLLRLYSAAEICRWNNEWPFLSSPTFPKIDFFNPDYALLRLQPYHSFLEITEQHCLTLRILQHLPSIISFSKAEHPRSESQVNTTGIVQQTQCSHGTKSG